MRVNDFLDRLKQRKLVQWALAYIAEFFADGLSEEILNSLARIDGMQVVGRTSSFQFKGNNDDLRTIGDTLGVASVLEGSVRREGHRKPELDLIDTLRLANVEFDKAIAREPDFSLAYFAEADYYEHTLMADGRSQAERLDAQKSGLRTLELAAEHSADAQQHDLALAERQILSDDWHARRHAELQGETRRIRFSLAAGHNDTVSATRAGC